MITGSDYQKRNIIVEVPARTLSQLFTVNITNDVIVEYTEMFNVEINSVSTCAITIGGCNRSEINIIDDDGEFHILYVCT